MKENEKQDSDADLLASKHRQWGITSIPISVAGECRREVIWLAVRPDGDNHMVIGRSQDTGQFETIEGIASAGAAVAEARRLLEGRGYVAHVCDVHEAADVMADWQACHAITNQE